MCCCNRYSWCPSAAAAPACAAAVGLPVQVGEEERKRLLSFVVVGGGPTGIEMAAELHDVIYEDLKVKP